MKLSHSLLLATVLSLLTSWCCAQSSPVADSLQRMYNEAKEDTTRLFYLDELVWERMYYDIDLAAADAGKALKESYRTGNPALMARAHHTLGTVYLQQSIYDSASAHLKRSIELHTGIGLNDKAASSYNGLGNVYLYKGMNENALHNYLKALDLADPAKKEKKALLYSNIGIVYHNLNSLAQSLGYYERSLKISQEIGDSVGLAACYSNMGNVYRDMKDYKQAEKYHQEALRINESLNLLFRVAENYNNIGLVYLSTEDHARAIECFLKTEELSKELNHPEGLASVYVNLSSVYNTKGEYDKAMEYLHASLDICRELDSKDKLFKTLGNLYPLYLRKKDYKKAFEYLEQYTLLKDTLYGEETSKQVAEMQTKYDTEKKEKEIQLQAAQIEKQNSERNAFVGGCVLLLVFGAVVSREYLQKKKANRQLSLQKIEIQEKNNSLQSANQEITHQSMQLEEKNKNITDSIRYAKRIQKATLPPLKVFEENLSDYFILYKPKDIVSGDFYWAVRTACGKFIYAVSDCTGHGVPGAFMSLIGTTFLNEIVVEKQIKRPDLVLNELRKNVIKALNPEGSEEEGKDGMDITLCSLDMAAGVLEYASAYNGLFLVRDGELTAYPGDKFPVGKHGDHEKDFTLHTIDLKKGDCIYTFSDGYSDQFGGEKGKKFMHAQFKKLISSISHEPMPAQCRMLDETFETWKQGYEQVDDVCVTGLRV